MNQIHCLKLNMRFANAVKRGEKNFEIRKNDRGFQKGDWVAFRIVNDKGEDPYKQEMSPLYNRLYEITYVMNGWGLKEDYCVFGIREIETNRDPVTDCKAFRTELLNFWDKCEDDE